MKIEPKWQRRWPKPLVSQFEFLREQQMIIIKNLNQTVMNIEKLLKKLDKQSVQKKDCHLQVGANLKTYQSIGTVNSTCDQNDKSFVLPQPKHIKSVGYPSNCSKLDGQLENIQRMKNLYESRKMRNRIMSSVQRSSIDKSAGSGAKSLEKHILKPSNTPSFNKIQKQNKTIINNDSACKSLYTQQLLETSQSSNQPHSKVSKSKTNQIIYQYPDSNINIDNEEPYEEQLPYFTEQSLSHIANISQDFPHTDHIYPKNKKQPIDNEQKSQKCSCQCVSQREMESILQKFQQKFEQLTIRIIKMQRQNAQLKQNQYEIMCETQKYKQALENSRQQQDRMSMELHNQKQQKQELQLLLKDVLYKRQRERMLSSKENTFRENENKQISEKKAMKQNICIQTQSTTDLKSALLNKSSARQSQSKMKVQNLLHKLQIKVDRA